LANAWPMPGQGLPNAWPMPNQCLANAYPMPAQCLPNACPTPIPSASMAAQCLANGWICLAKVFCFNGCPMSWHDRIKVHLNDYSTEFQ
jgi:hypothetical protein